MSCVSPIQEIRGKGQEKLSFQKCRGHHQTDSGSPRGGSRGAKDRMAFEEIPQTSKSDEKDQSIQFRISENEARDIHM